MEGGIARIGLHHFWCGHFFLIFRGEGLQFPPCRPWLHTWTGKAKKKQTNNNNNGLSIDLQSRGT